MASILNDYPCYIDNVDTFLMMRAFVSVVSEGSFSGAADRLDLSPQLVSKYVGRLESRLGARLLNRSTRRLSLTEAGQAYVERARQVLADMDEMEAAVGDLAAGARGTLRINAPMSFGVTHLSRAIADYRVQQPHVGVELTLNDRIVDVIGEGFDVAIRIGRLDASSLVARRLAPARLVACASPDYLARHGVPTRPGDLAHHACLDYAYSPERGRWRFHRDGAVHEVAVAGPVTANNGDALLNVAIAGGGVVVQPTFIAGEALRAGSLVRLLDDYEVAPRSIYALYAHRQYLSAKVRTFVDFLAERFGDTPYWD